jgi:hypothetical protein
MRSGVRPCLRTCTSTRSRVHRWTGRRRTDRARLSSATTSRRRPLPLRIITPSPLYLWCNPHLRALMNPTCIPRPTRCHTSTRNGQGPPARPFLPLSLPLLRPRLRRRGTCRRQSPRKAPCPRHPLLMQAHRAFSFTLHLFRIRRFIRIIGLEDAAFDDPPSPTLRIIIRIVISTPTHARLALILCL